MATVKTVKGLLGTKLGMTQVWDENNKLVPVTVIEIAPNVVTQVRSEEVDGYVAVQIAAGAIDPRKVNQPSAGHFAKAGVNPRRHLTEVRTPDAADYTPGQELTVEGTFEAGQLVDVVGTSKGKGFAGVMKRHNFKGVSASHGAHRNHRKPGSIGASSTPSRVFKGMRMAGRMGGERVTVQNLKVHAVDAERGLLLVKGAVPGAKGRLVFVRNAVKGAQHMAANSISVFDAKGKQTGSVELPDALFDVTTNVPLLHQVVVAQLAAARQGTHKTKNRGEVSGAGRKPFKQKGTGRSRQGSVRAPEHRGGGVVHGPTPRDYSQRTPKKMIAAALLGSLSDRARGGRIAAVSSFGEGKTKDAAALLNVIAPTKRVLVVTERADETAVRAVRNLAAVHVISFDQLNAYDVLVSDDVVFTTAALEGFIASKTAKSEVSA